MLARVRRTLRERELVQSGDRVLVACSGGPDSAALLFALARLAPEAGFSVEAASVDHGLRPDSHADVDRARAQAGAAGVPFHALSVSVEPGPALQARARVERYRVLLDLAAQLGATRLATGHTRDDQAETVLMRVLRGSGLSGLSGIQPRRADGVIRPLLDCERRDVHAFARHACPVPLAADPSNDDPRFERVRVRRELLPALRLENPSIVEHLGNLADDARAAALALSREADVVLQRARASGGLTSRVLAAAPPAVRRMALAAWLRRETGGEPGRAHLDQLDHGIVTGGRIEVRLPGGFRVASTILGELCLTWSEPQVRDAAG